ncbi:aminodeoxychorismate synthase component I [candidate division KSB1 bacterium]|nr:aminodeoxychorismate synthase component I [candidate division KSB1 bacterium]
MFKDKKKWANLPDPEYNPGEELQWQADISKNGYNKAIEKIKNQLASGATYQVNFTYRLRSPFHGNTYALFHRLQQNMNPLFGAFIKTDHFSICSGSPELFFELDNDSLHSRPMKGTCPRGMTLEQDRQAANELRNSNKNQAENVMIVDMIRNDMGRIATPGSVQVSRLFELEKYSSVWQMTSTVKAGTKASVTNIFEALFPCASITGAPKPQTMKIIRKLEQSPRNIYTGAIGLIGPNRQARFNVAIRTAWIDHRSRIAEFGTGGGIVWDSEAKSEFTETLDKSSILHQTWPKFHLLETLLWTQDEDYFLLEKHIKRMRDSAEYFDFKWKEESVWNVLQNRIAEFSKISQRVRLLLYQDGSLTLENNPILNSDKKGPLRLKLCPYPIQTKNVFLYHKTTHRKVYEKAQNSCMDCDDVILWNEKDEITETTIANIVIKLEGQYWTPPVSCGLLNGTFRSWLIDQGKIKERVMSKEVLDQCEEIICVNSVRKWIKAIMVN